jgi:predicted nucleic acid-binding protein
MTLVLDASACAEFLLGTPAGAGVADTLGDADIHAPHLMVSECASVLRGWNLSGHLGDRRAESATKDLAMMPWLLWDATTLLDTMWGPRHNISAYDATYVPLATMLGVPLVTTDARLAASAPSVYILVRASPPAGPSR